MFLVWGWGDQTGERLQMTATSGAVCARLDCIRFQTVRHKTKHVLKTAVKSEAGGPPSTSVPTT